MKRGLTLHAKMSQVEGRRSKATGYQLLAIGYGLG
jgi:hypothetical protein